MEIAQTHELSVWLKECLLNGCRLCHDILLPTFPFWEVRISHEVIPADVHASITQFKVKYVSFISLHSFTNLLLVHKSIQVTVLTSLSRELMQSLQISQAKSKLPTLGILS